MELYPSLFFEMKMGFSLIEILVVMVIVAVLASVALPTYKRYVFIAKSVEARNNIGAIMTCEDCYMNTDSNSKYLLQPYYPGHAGPEKQLWDPEKSGNFRTIGFVPRGSVYYDYGVAKYQAPLNLKSPDFSSNSVTATSGPDIAIIARGDLDGDGKYAYFFSTDVRYPEIRKIGDY